MNRSTKILSILLLVFTITLAKEKSYYCIQLATSSKLKPLEKIFEEVKNLPQSRIEKIGNYYTLRIGLWDTFKEAKAFAKKLEKNYKNILLRTCYYKPERWIKPKILKKNEYINFPEKTKISVDICPVIPQATEEERQRKTLIDVAYIESIYQNLLKVLSSQREKPIKFYFKEQKQETSAQTQTKAIHGQWYDFLDALYVRGQKEDNGCRHNGKELINKLGYRFLYPISDKLSFIGNIRVGLGYQNFKHTHRSKIWLSVQTLYLQYIKNAYWNIYFGRVPVRESRSFYYFNSLDGFKADFNTTLVRDTFFIGTRLNDSRVDNNEERNGIINYWYLINRFDYQYLYKQFLSIFFVKEYREKNGRNSGEVISVWESTLPKTDKNWLGLRIWGKKNKADYWIDLSYSWGKDSFIKTIADSCYGYRKVIRAQDKYVSGFGIEAGLKKILNQKVGIGGRFAFGSGSKSSKHDFRLPRISNSKDRLFGSNRIRYYGELTNPDLKNLAIFSLFGGYNIKDDVWLEANIIKYLRISGRTSVPFSRYFVATRNQSIDIGTEFDLTLDGAIFNKKNDYWLYLFTISYFLPGKAYNYRNDAYGFILRLKRYW